MSDHSKAEEESKCPPRGRIKTTSAFDQATRQLLLAFLLAISLSPFARANSLTTIDGQAVTLASQIQGPSTLVLFVANELELREAQRLLTIPDNELSHHLMVVVVLPSDQLLKEKLMLRAAKDFFKSEFSRQRVYLTKDKELAYPSSKALLYLPGEPKPIQRFETYPDF